MHEAVRVLRFGASGLAATGCHAAVLFVGLHLGATPTLGNLVAFLCAAVVSYVGQRVWVFGRAPKAFWRFAVVTGLGFGLHLVGMPALLGLGLAVWPAWLVLTVAVPAASFLAMRFWAFGTDEGADAAR